MHYHYFYNRKLYCYLVATTCNVKYLSPTFHYFKNLLSKKLTQKLQWCNYKYRKRIYCFVFSRGLGLWLCRQGSVNGPLCLNLRFPKGTPFAASDVLPYSFFTRQTKLYYSFKNCCCFGDSYYYCF